MGEGDALVTIATLIIVVVVGVVVGWSFVKVGRAYDGERNSPEAGYKVGQDRHLPRRRKW